MIYSMVSQKYFPYAQKCRLNPPVSIVEIQSLLLTPSPPPFPSPSPLREAMEEQLN